MAKSKKNVDSPITPGLKSKEEIVHNWLPRYTGRPLEEFGNYILLTNFSKYVTIFSEMHDNAPIYGEDKPMQVLLQAVSLLSILVWVAQWPQPSWIYCLLLLRKQSCF